MSDVAKKNIKCDKCESEFEVQLYNSVNVSLTSELKESVLKNNINHFTCPHCNSVVEKPFFYHDTQNKIMIWVWPEKDSQHREEILEQFENIKKTFRENVPPEMKNVQTGYYQDIAFGIDDLKAKLARTNK